MISMDPPTITLDELIARHDALLLDAYGVLVSLDGALPGAPGLIDYLNRSGKPYWILSNTAARLPESASVRYRGFGLDIPAERILTSGVLLAAHFLERAWTGRRCAVLGPADSRVYVERAGGIPEGWDDDFEILVLADQAGFPMPEAVDAVISRLFARMDAGLETPLLLPNPDLIYPTGAGYGITAGSLALMIEAILARRYGDSPACRFTRLGKPHPALFQEAVRCSGSRNPVMIGDQLETDIAGAQASGIASALLAGGVSRGISPADGPRPTWLLPSLALKRV